jgi:hypothetical protein
MVDGILDRTNPMRTKIQIDYIWIPASLGGHSGSPRKGMRTEIRWQRYLAEFLEGARDVQWEELSFDPDTLQGSATCSFSPDVTIPNEWLQDGELVELLNGFRVLAVARIRSRE